ncbi:nuclease-like protein [Thermochaetoides thermophila DSM 1495]|uniref:Nuclease-like protein n=1 Tax=Chaetomium thermophilum (strain DSM 1495 / CBS 144.50 / IMI 039719) TaxID=759272 RepID=G0RZM3_CHATD|nr:nuclease-like protein [Thermochaetoides thermophila DSM 1495]EGS23651.1 nuclease-like protein [Thermochaetoides thermophila DSM 1495]
MPLLLLDFDGTITCTDTLHALISLSIARTTKCMSELKTTSQKRPNTAALFSLWDDIVREYVAAHTAHSAQYRPREEDRREIDDEFDYLESVKPIEKASVARVGAAGFFAGLVSWEEAKYESVEDVETRKWGLRDLGRSAVLHSKDTNVPPDGGGELCVEVRKGFGEFMKRFGGTNTDDWEVAVVSVNWSAEFIRGEVKGPAELGGDVLVSVKDKLRAMKSVMKLDGKERVVYFGDSTTDLACLLAADLGVVVADNTETKLMKTLRRMRFKIYAFGHHWNNDIL